VAALNDRSANATDLATAIGPTGEIASLYELIYGRSYFTQEPASRWWAAAGVATLGLGRVVGKFAAQKALPSTGGVVREFEQVGDKVYYRVFSGDANVGAWLTAIPPRSSSWAQDALALPLSNNAAMIQEVLVPSGTLLQRSRAIPMPEWGRMRGGAEQFKLLDEIPLRNFGPGRPLP
jgi:hypothetical protein